MKVRIAADALEDLEWLDSTGVGAAEAARRTGFPTAHAMEKWLEREGRYDLWQRFKHRDPEGMHNKPNRRPAVTETVDTYATLIAAATRSTKARTRNRGKRIEAMLDELRESLDTERREERIKETARKDVERLERELSQAKARLRGGGVQLSAVQDGPSAADIRAWAAENGIECPAMGRVPAAVREAFDAAHADDEDAA